MASWMVFFFWFKRFFKQLIKIGIVNFNLSSGLTGDSSVSLGDSLNISLGEIPNSALANPTITVNPAAGLTGDSTVELGGTLLAERVRVAAGHLLDGDVRLVTAGCLAADAPHAARADPVAGLVR